jgi:hypothetical protein
VGRDAADELSGDVFRIAFEQRDRLRPLHETALAEAGAYPEGLREYAGRGGARRPCIAAVPLSTRLAA